MGKCWECLMVPLKAFGLDNKLFVHKSVKFHVVDDPWVVATAAFVKLGVLAYILWAMLHPAQRQYFAFEIPSGSTAMWTLSSGFPEGIPSMPAGLCDKLPEYDILYGGGWDLLDFSCREYFYGDVVRKMDEARAIQLTTVVTEKSLAWSDCLSDAGPDHSGGCQNRTTGATAHYFVPHVDDAVIVIAHSYDAPISRKSGQNPKTKIRDHKGSIKDTLEEGENIELSLRDLLEYSGLDSLEARNKQAQGTATGPPTYRQSGVVIEIQINYDNRRRLDGSKVLAEATVKYRDIGWSSFWTADAPLRKERRQDGHGVLPLRRARGCCADGLDRAFRSVPIPRRHCPVYRIFSHSERCRGLRVQLAPGRSKPRSQVQAVRLRADAPQAGDLGGAHGVAYGRC